MAAAPGEIDEYKILRALGRGGMGAVFLARDRQLDRLVAIKMIDRAGHHADAVTRFRIEARALARLAHPNVVTVHRIGEHDGQPFIVYEYVEGTSLDQRARPTTPAQARAIALGLVRGLAAAHREGILHRDLKPANAMLATDGTVKLLDFGLAKLRDGDAGGEPAPVPSPVPLAEAQTLADTGRPISLPPPTATPPAPASTLTFEGAAPIAGSNELTRAGSRMGTPRYMSPEAWRGLPMTAASDVYSAGLVLWELFADRHPFEGVAADALAARACDHDVPSLATAAGPPPAALVALIDRCVRRDPAERPADAVALLDELERIAPVTPRRPRGRIAAAAVAVVIVGGSGAALWRRGDRRTAVVAPPDAAVAVAPRALTRLAGCATEPVFIDAATIAFTFMKDDDVDVYTIAGGAPTRVTTTAGWDWRPAPGRHPGELLYVRDGDDGRNRMVAYSRAAATDREVGVGYAVAAIGRDLYYLTDDAVGEIRRRTDDGVVTTIATLPAGRSPESLVAAPGGERLAVVASDREGATSVCVIDPGAAAATPSCLATRDLQVGRPAFVEHGRDLLYPSRDGIRRIDVARGADTLAVGGVRASGGVALSPDGTRLVFSDCRSYGSIVAVSATAREVLIDDGLARSPRAGPGDTLGYVASRDGGGTRLMVMTPGQPARELVADAGELGAPAFERHGDRIAYAQAEGLRVYGAGGAIEAWTSGPGDRGPVWTAHGGLAFTRLGDGGAPSAMVVTAPGAPPRLLAAGWTVQDLDYLTGAIVVIRDGHVALLDPERPDPGRPVPIAAGPTDGSVVAAVAAPDGRLMVMSVTTTTELFAIDRATGAASLLHRVPSGQTVGAPTLLADGRLAFRAEIWLGELYEQPAPPAP